MSGNNPAEQTGDPAQTGTLTTDVTKNPAKEGETDAGKEAEAKAQRYLEQLHGREEQLKKTEARLINHETDKVEKDNAYFLNLMEEDPVLAEKVAKQFGKASAKEAAEAVRAAMQANGNEPAKMSKPVVDEEELFRKWEEKREMRDAEKEARALFEELSAENKETATKRFEKLIEGRKLSKSEMKEIAEMAVLYANKDALLGSAKDKALAALASTGLHKPSDANAKSGKSSVAGADELAKAMGLGALYSDKK